MCLSLVPPEGSSVRFIPKSKNAPCWARIREVERGALTTIHGILSQCKNSVGPSAEDVSCSRVKNRVGSK